MYTVRLVGGSCTFFMSWPERPGAECAGTLRPFACFQKCNPMCLSRGAGVLDSVPFSVQRGRSANMLPEHTVELGEAVEAA